MSGGWRGGGQRCVSPPAVGVMPQPSQRGTEAAGCPSTRARARNAAQKLQPQPRTSAPTTTTTTTTTYLSKRMVRISALRLAPLPLGAVFKRDRAISFFEPSHEFSRAVSPRRMSVVELLISACSFPPCFSTSSLSSPTAGAGENEGCVYACGS